MTWRDFCLFHSRRSKTMASVAAAASEMGMVYQTPLTPRMGGRTRRRGMMKMTCRVRERKRDFPG